MAVSKQNVKIKADIFASKLAEYIVKHTKNNKSFLFINNSDNIKNHRILLTKSETSEILELIKEEKKNIKLKKNTLKEDIFNTLNNKIADTLSNKSFIITQSGKLNLNQDKQVFKLSETMIQELSPTRQAVEVKGASTYNKEIKQDFVKMKALTFISKISTKISPKAKKLNSFLVEENNLEQEQEQIKSEKDKYVLWGLKIGETTKKEALEILKKYSKEKTDYYKNKDFIIYSDLSITIHFDENNILKELELNEFFNGETEQGLKIGNSIEKAIKMYGQPLESDDKSIAWKNFKVSYISGKIFSINIFNNEMRFVFEKNKTTEKFIVYTQGFLLGIIIAESTKSVIINGNNRKYVVNFMKDYSNIKVINNLSNYISYDDIGIKFTFDENNIVSEIEFTEEFIGKTVNELKIGDSLDKAIEIYGHPHSSIQNKLSWGKMTALIQDYIIKGITVHK